jgi:hypothetical protein
MVAVLSSHDEPFVIDNGPLAIDVGYKHSKDGDVIQDPLTKDWLRGKTELDRILVLVVSPRGEDIIESYQADVDKRSPVVFELGKSDDRLTLDWPNPTMLRIHADRFTLYRPNDGRRLKQPGNGGRRISKISGGGLSDIDLSDIGNNAKVFVVLQARKLEHPDKS